MSVHGKKAVFKLDTAAGALTDISAKCDNVDFPQTTESHEDTTFGAEAKSYLVGLEDSSVSLSGNFDAALDTHLSELKAALRAGTLASASFEYGPAGSAVGMPKYTGEITVMPDYSISSPVGDKVTFSAELQVSGLVTRSLYE